MGVSPAGLADLQRRLCDLACGTESLPGFRQRCLELVNEAVPFDRGVFHELSPRAAADRAALVGVSRKKLAASQRAWDELAVALGRLRDMAMSRQGVVGTVEALPPKSAGRRTWKRVVAPLLGAPEALVAHLVVEERIVSALILGRQSGRFGPNDEAWLRALVPTLSVCDALRQRLRGQPASGLVPSLRCVDQRLTERERELVVHVALGNTDVEVGRALSISPHTVRNHLVTIRRKLGAANRAEIVRLAVLR